MNQLTLVAETRLLESQNAALYDYFGSYSQLFCFLVRRTIHHLRRRLNGEKESVYRTKLMEEQQITNRMAKAVIRTAKNQLKLLTESARYQYDNLYTRKSKLIKKIVDCKKRLDKRPAQRTKIKLFYLQMKLNNVNQRIANGVKPHLTFGTKQYLKNNKSKFLAKRDNQMVYIGDKNETSGNQQFQIRYNSKRNRFDYKIRYDNKWITEKIMYINQTAVSNDRLRTQCIAAQLESLHIQMIMLDEPFSLGPFENYKDDLIEGLLEKNGVASVPVTDDGERTVYADVYVLGGAFELKPAFAMLPPHRQQTLLNILQSWTDARRQSINNHMLEHYKNKMRAQVVRRFKNL